MNNKIHFKRIIKRIGSRGNKNICFRYTSAKSLLRRISASCTVLIESFFSINHGDFIQYTVCCAGMSKYKTEETVVAAHAVGHDCVCGRYCVLLSHHRR